MSDHKLKLKNEVLRIHHCFLCKHLFSMEKLKKIKKQTERKKKLF